MNALLQALPAAADALLLARRYYPHLDPAAAWLAWVSLGHTDDAQRIAAFLTAAVRREAAAERIDHAICLRPQQRADEDDMPLGCADPGLLGADPAALLEAAQEAAQRMATAGVMLTEADPAPTDTLAMARMHGRTRRRMQQVLAPRAAADRAGQLGLFA